MQRLMYCFSERGSRKLTLAKWTLAKNGEIIAGYFRSSAISGPSTFERFEASFATHKTAR